MTFGKKCKEIFDKAAEAVRDAFTPQPQLQPIPIPVRKPEQRPRR
jgi:hypothetical protein